MNNEMDEMELDDLMDEMDESLWAMDDKISLYQNEY